MRINQTTVQAIELPSKLSDGRPTQSLHYDDELKGFGLRVTSGGARSFFVEKRIRARNKRHTLGRWPALKPDQARKDAQAWLGAIASGRDPVAEREREKLSKVTLEEAFDSYMELKRRSKDGLPLKARTRDDMTEVLKSSLEEWKRRPLQAITRPMVERKYKQLADRSAARANVAMRYLRAVFNFEMDRNVDVEGRSLIADNPVRVLKRQWRAVGRRKRVLKPDDLPAWIAAVNALADVPEREPGTGKENPKLRHGDAFRDWLLFLALTGCRPCEAHDLLPSDVDLAGRKLTFRDTKNRLDHELPLTDFLHELLSRRIAAGGDRVFASPHDGRGIGNYRYAVARVRSACGVHFTPGDLRRLASTAMESEGVARYTLKAILNHIDDGEDVTAGYVQVNATMKLAALEKIEAYVLRQPAKVVPFRRTGGVGCR